MIQRDYILRLIEQFFQALQKALGQRGEQSYTQALLTIHKAYKSFLGAGGDYIDSQSADDLIASMRDGLLGPDQIVMAAKLLSEEGNIHEATSAPDRALDCRRKALRLYLEVFCGPGAPRLKSFFPEIEQLAERLTVDGFSLDSARLLPLYWEKSGRFDKAEDALFNAARAAAPSDPVWAIGRGFYERLGALTGRELEQGELPRTEVEDGAREWRAMEKKAS